MELEIDFFDTTLVVNGTPGLDEHFEIDNIRHKLSGCDCMWLLFSTLCDDVHDATHMAWSEWRKEERICAAEAKADQRREERMWHSC